MRIRTIKPEFFKHDGIAELAPLTRLLFVSLWCIADRRGRLEDRPKRIKAECLPYDDCDVDAMLWELHNAGFIERYEAEGVAVVEITSFEKHQRISGKEADTESDLPEKQQGSAREAPGVALVAQERKGKERKGKEYSETEIEAIYSAYPRKVGRGDAIKAIEKALRKVDASTLLASVQDYARSCAGKDPQYIPHPSTWFNGERWADEMARRPTDDPTTLFADVDLSGMSAEDLARL